MSSGSSTVKSGSSSSSSSSTSESKEYWTRTRIGAAVAGGLFICFILYIIISNSKSEKSDDIPEEENSTQQTPSEPSTNPAQTPSSPDKTVKPSNPPVSSVKDIAFCQLRSKGFNNGIVTWEFWTVGGTTYNNGFTLHKSNTLVVQPYAGLYEITVSGNAVAQSSLFVAIDLNVNNIKNYNIAYQSSSAISTFIVNVSGSQLSRPYVSTTPTSTGWSVNCNGGKFYSLDFPLYMIIKFISV